MPAVAVILAVKHAVPHAAVGYRSIEALTQVERDHIGLIQGNLSAEPLAGEGKHFLGVIDADHLEPTFEECFGKQPRANTHLEHPGSRRQNLRQLGALRCIVIVAAKHQVIVVAGEIVVLIYRVS